MAKEFDGDRRSEPRHSICIDVNVITPKSSFEAVATNISGGGLEIQVSSLINPKTNLIISMQLQEEFVFKGIVIWTLGNCIGNQWSYRVGIKTETIAFKNMSATSPKEKADLVEKILPQIKAKGVGINFRKLVYG